MESEQLTALYQAGGVLGIVLAGGFFAFRWVMAEVNRLGAPGPVKKISTEVYTTDTAAMSKLSATLAQLNATVEQTNQMLREGVRQHEIDEEVERRVRNIRSNPEK